VKRGSDAAVFDRLFELYFVGIKDLLEGLQGSLLAALEAEQLTADELEQAAQELSRMQLSDLTQALVQGAPTSSPASCARRCRRSISAD